MIILTCRISFAAGEWKISAGYSRIQSPLLDNIHRNYAFTRLSADTGISLLGNGFFLQGGARFDSKKSYPVYAVFLSWSRYSASHTRDGFLDVSLHRINLLPSVGFDLLSETKNALHLSLGPIAGLHIFSVDKFSGPLQLEDDIPYRPALFNWGLHTGLSYRLAFIRSFLDIFIQTEWFPYYYTGNYSSALLGTSYPWIPNRGFAMNVNAGLSFSLPWKS